MKPTLSFSCALALVIAAIASPTAAAATKNLFMPLSECLREAKSGRGARTPRWAVDCSAVGHECKPERRRRGTATAAACPRNCHQHEDGRKVRQRRHQL